MNSEQNKPLPLVTPSDASLVGLRCVIFGLAQYVFFLPNESKEKQLCFEALDRLRSQFDNGTYQYTENELAELLEAFGGFLLTLYHLHPEKDTLRKFITSWCGRLKMQVTTPQ